MVQQAVSVFVGRLVACFHSTEVLANNLRLIKNLYELVDIPNEVKDIGESIQPLVTTDDEKAGLGIEFRLVEATSRIRNTETSLPQECIFQISTHGSLCYSRYVAPHQAGAALCPRRRERKREKYDNETDRAAV